MYEHANHEYGGRNDDGGGSSGCVCSFLLFPDEATVVSVNMFVRDFIEINDLKMVIMKPIFEENFWTKTPYYFLPGGLGEGGYGLT